MAGHAFSYGDCDYCELRFGLSRIGDSVVCSSCAVSRVARIAAVAQRRARHSSTAEPEDITPEAVDVFDEELGL